MAVWQLLDVGFSLRQVEVRVERGRLHRVHWGVYAVGHPARSREALDMAGVLAYGPDALLSHWNATSRWGLLKPRNGPIHVSARRDHRERDGTRIHRVKQLHPHDCTKRDGIPITSVPRTLLDIAAVADERVLRRAVNQAERAGWLNRRAIAELLERNPRRKGSKSFRAVIAAVSPGTRRTRSDLEAAFLSLLEKYGLPRPLVNTKVEGVEVDMYWPGTKLIVELDSYEYHRTPHEFENDRVRDAGLKLARYEVLRVGEGWLEADPAGVAATVRGLLAS